MPNKSEEEKSILSQSTSSNESFKTPPKNKMMNLDENSKLSQGFAQIENISINNCPKSTNLDKINPFCAKEDESEQDKGGRGCLRYNYEDEDEIDEKKNLIGDESRSNDYCNSPKVSSSFRVPPCTPSIENDLERCFINPFDNSLIMGIGHRSNFNFNSNQRKDSITEIQEIQENEQKDEENANQIKYLSNSNTFGTLYSTSSSIKNNFSLTIPELTKEKNKIKNLDQNSSSPSPSPGPGTQSSNSILKIINRPRQPSFPIRLTASLLLARKSNDDDLIE